LVVFVDLARRGFVFCVDVALELGRAELVRATPVFLGAEFGALLRGVDSPCGQILVTARSWDVSWHVQVSFLANVVLDAETGAKFGVGRNDFLGETLQEAFTAVVEVESGATTHTVAPGGALVFVIYSHRARSNATVRRLLSFLACELAHTEPSLFGTQHGVVALRSGDKATLRCLLLEEAEVVLVVVDERLALLVAVAASTARLEVVNPLSGAVAFVVDASDFQVFHVSSARVVVHEEDVFVVNVAIKTVALDVPVSSALFVVRLHCHSLSVTVVQTTCSSTFQVVLAPRDVESFTNGVVVAGHHTLEPGPRR